jgi:Inner membrane protein YgaP-like, transmembrane domain
VSSEEEAGLANGTESDVFMEMIIRRFAGSFILVSLLLAHYHSAYWLWVTAFVGFNLLQSSFTKFCPLEIILRRAGVGVKHPVVDKPVDSCCTR